MIVTISTERINFEFECINSINGRPELDIDRIGITGHSGGATVALFAAALSNWIAVAASCCYFCSYEDAILVIEHCEGNYMPRLIDLGEMWAGTGLVAHGRSRSTQAKTTKWFPIDTPHRAYDELTDLYQIVEADQRCSLYVGDGGHRFYEDVHVVGLPEISLAVGKLASAGCQSKEKRLRESNGYMI